VAPKPAAALMAPSPKAATKAAMRKAPPKNISGINNVLAQAWAGMFLRNIGAAGGGGGGWGTCCDMTLECPLQGNAVLVPYNAPLRLDLDRRETPQQEERHNAPDKSPKV